MANDKYLDMIAILGTSGTLPPLDLLVAIENPDADALLWRAALPSADPESGPSAPIKNPPFFITVKPSEKGKKASVKEREDGLYLGDVKISDREILVRGGA